MEVWCLHFRECKRFFFTCHTVPYILSNDTFDAILFTDYNNTSGNKIYTFFFYSNSIAIRDYIAKEKFLSICYLK